MIQKRTLLFALIMCGSLVTCCKNNRDRIALAQQLSMGETADTIMELCKKESLKKVYQFLQDPKNLCLEDKIEKINKCYYEIDRRYNSWWRPWNWTADMHQALLQIQPLHYAAHRLSLIEKYSPFLAIYDAQQQKFAHTFKTVLQKKYLKKYLGNSYPVMRALEDVQMDLVSLRTKDLDCALDESLIKYLNDLSDALTNTAEYKTESTRLYEQSVNSMKNSINQMSSEMAGLKLQLNKQIQEKNNTMVDAVNKL
jgi:hypothetical protein